MSLHAAGTLLSLGVTPLKSRTETRKEPLVSGCVGSLFLTVSHRVGENRRVTSSRTHFLLVGLFFFLSYLHQNTMRKESQGQLLVKHSTFNEQAGVGRNTLLEKTTPK